MSLPGLVCRALLVSAFWAGLASAAEIRYLYSPSGEIYAVIDVDGSAAVFNFDEAGNVISIVRSDASAIPGNIGITLVSPNQGLPNDVIEIFGKGMANPTSVTFNGVAATTILESTANYIKTQVPTGATTGIIHVTTALGGADSPSPFTILGSLTITPTLASLPPGRSQQFVASGPALWLVNGILNGSAEIGVVTSGGLYTVPSTGRLPQEVTVAAQSPGDPLNRAEARVTIVPVPGARAPFVSVLRTPSAPTPTDTGRSRLVSVVPGATLSSLPAHLVGVHLQPTVTAVEDPATGLAARIPRNTTQNIRLRGAGFSGTPTVQLYLGIYSDTNITVNSRTVDSPTQMTVNITISSAAATGLRTVTVGSWPTYSTFYATGGNLLEVLP